MTTANQAFRQAANSPAGRHAAKSAKEARDAVRSAADSARSVAEDFADTASDYASDAARKAGDFASDMSRCAGREFDRARGAAADAWDELHDASERNPHLSLAIAAGIGFLIGAFLVGRR
jgi:ElaB/YqjD/DUF883 family membrane-anchored ribosome-binding protein